MCIFFNFKILKQNTKGSLNVNFWATFMFTFNKIGSILILYYFTGENDSILTLIIWIITQAFCNVTEFKGGKYSFLTSDSLYVLFRLDFMAAALFGIYPCSVRVSKIWEIFVKWVVIPTRLISCPYYHLVQSYEKLKGFPFCERWKNVCIAVRWLKYYH